MHTHFSLLRTLGLLAGCLLCTLFCVGRSAARTPEGSDAQALGLLQKISEEMNKSCPVSFDGTTSLRTTGVQAPRTLRFWLTVPDTTSVERLRTEVVPLMRKMVTDTPAMQPLRDAGTCFSFWFETPGEEHLFDFEVSPEEYRGRSSQRR